MRRPIQTLAALALTVAVAAGCATTQADEERGRVWLHSNYVDTGPDLPAAPVDPSLGMRPRPTRAECLWPGHDLTPSSPALVKAKQARSEGVAAMDRGRAEEAVERLLTAYRWVPSYHRFQVEIGDAALAAKDCDRALLALGCALELLDDFPERERVLRDRADRESVCLAPKQRWASRTLADNARAEIVGGEVRLDPPLRWSAADPTALADQSEYVLDVLAHRLAEFPDRHPVAIEAHTTSKGHSKENRALAAARACRIVDALVERGIDRGDLEARGVGEEDPLRTSDPDRGIAPENERVVVWLVSGDARTTGNGPARSECGPQEP